MKSLAVISHLMSALIIVEAVLTEDELKMRIAANGPTIKEVIQRALEYGREYEDEVSIESHSA